MRVIELEKDILVFRGEAYESVSTAFVRGNDVLLVDALASPSDAAKLRDYIELVLGKTVRAVVMTHYMNDHMAALPLFPDAEIVAHRHFIHTYLSQRGRSVEDDTMFVRPTTRIADSLHLVWGRHSLEVFHNPGKTLCTLCIDVPGSDLAFASDNVVGHIAYLSSGAPELIDGAIESLQRRGRRRIVGGHIGILPGEALANARHYLVRLRALVEEAFRSTDPAGAVRSIAIEDCVSPGVTPVPFEREWHGHNLDVVLERRPYAVASGEPRGH